MLQIEGFGAPKDERDISERDIAFWSSEVGLGFLYSNESVLFGSPKTIKSALFGALKWVWALYSNESVLFGSRKMIKNALFCPAGAHPTAVAPNLN